MGTSVGDYRPLWVAYSANLTTGGIINVVHSPTYPATYVAASHVDASWGNTLQGVSNSLWTVSTSTLAFNGATGIIRFGGTGFGTNALTDLDASLLASVIGTHGAATNVNTTYEVNRTALTTANIANAWRIGTRNVTASPLPIVLRQFAAEPADDHVGLSWETASELNSDHFTLERSSDGRAFVFVQKVSASGNSSSIRRYAFEDHDALEGLNYYRLKLFDKDGSDQSFPLVFADLRRTPLNEVQLFPNPSTGYVDVKGWKAGSTDQVVVMDESGRLVKTSLYSGRLDLSDLIPGVYTVKLISGAQTRVQKLVISK
ncbi:MAG TPA: T9SS type A sorting domain-containing protein [Bacteroidia bacterium]|nr:T9SS type A sorting domain-containing protein [Bacteroidia bacterium]